MQHSPSKLDECGTVAGNPQALERSLGKSQIVRGFPLCEQAKH